MKLKLWNWIRTHKVWSLISIGLLITLLLLGVSYGIQIKRDIDQQNDEQNFVNAMKTALPTMIQYNPTRGAILQTLNACQAYIFPNPETDKTKDSRFWGVENLYGDSSLEHEEFISEPGDAITYAGESVNITDNTGTFSLHITNSAGVVYNTTGKPLIFSLDNVHVKNGEIAGAPANQEYIEKNLNHGLCLSNQLKVKLTEITIPQEAQSWLPAKIDFYKELLPKK